MAFLRLLVALVLFLAAACGGGGEGRTDPPPGPGPVTLLVSPLSTIVELGSTEQFTATVTRGAVTWQVIGGAANGTIAGGLYTAPAAMPASSTVVVRCASAEDPSVQEEATVTLTEPPSIPGFPVALHVGTVAGWSGVSVPVTSGVPLPRGIHANLATLRVTTAAGTPVPAQFRALSRWSDGSLRWVLVDFQADLSGGEYRLDGSGSGAPSTNLTVTESAGAIDVSTGVLAFRVSRTAFRLFESVKIDRDNDGQVDDECLDTAALNGVVVADGGTGFRMDQAVPDSISVEEAGPMRVCIRAEGRHRASPGGADRLRWIVRIHAWNNLPYVKVVYTFKNTQLSGQPNGDNAAQAAQVASHVDADAVTLELPLVFPSAPSALFGGSAGTHGGTLGGGQSATLFQTYTGAYDATDSGNPQPAGSDGSSSDPLTNAWATGGPEQITYSLSGAVSGSGGHAPGWMQMAAGSASDLLRVSAVLRDFWQLHPKTLTAQGNGLLKIGIWPDEAWRLQVFEGAMKTHEVLLAFERAASTSSAAAGALADLANDAPFAACDPLHYRNARVFGEIAVTNAAMTDVSRFQPAHQARAAAYMSEFLRHLGDLVGDRADGNGSASGHEYGMWNYGDDKINDAEGAWENQHWSISRACFAWFAASGNRDVLAFGDTALRHFRDVDVLHSDVGRRYSYSEPGNASCTANGTSQLGKSRYNPSNKQHHLGNYHGGSMNFETLKGEMLGDHYLLYGDGLSLEVLQEAYVYLRGTWKRFFDSRYGGQDETMNVETRWISNAMFLAVSAYECTGAAEAKALAEYTLARSRQRQTTVTPNDPLGIGFATGSGFFQTWMFGHLVESLDWYRWIMEDATVDNDLENAMTWILGPDAAVYDGNGHLGETPGNTANYGSVNLMLGAGYAAALRSSGDAAWIGRAAVFLDAQLPELQGGLFGVNHKSTAQRFRAGPLLLRAFE